jgi:phage repressor protein C with HTH and peptisase S24 domain
MENLRDYITNLLSARKKSKIELANFMGVAPQVVNTILVKSNPRKSTVKKIADFLEIKPEELQFEIDRINGRFIDNKNNQLILETTATRVKAYEQLIELPYVPAACRATFAETYTNQNIMETFTIFAEPNESYDKDIIFEVNGDSMEPYYYDKMKVRARLVDVSEWEYINSGVFIVAYRNHLVIKRIKNNDLMSLGHLQLHSDNTTLGGSQIIPKKELQHIWRVVRIVDAPVR